MAFTGGNIKMLNYSLTALNGQNLNLVTTGAGQVLVNGDVVTSSGNFNTLAAQVALNTSNIGAPSSNVLSPTLYAGVSSALSGGANDSNARTALSGSANDSNARTALSGSANDSTARTSASNAQTAANNAQTTANNAQTTADVSRVFTLRGSTIAGVISYNTASNVNIDVNTWTDFTTIQLKVPPDWTTGSGLSVSFDGYAYYNFDSNVASYYAIYYNSPPINSTFLPLIGDKSTPGIGITDSIYGGNAGQAYLPLNLTIPPTYLSPASGGGVINLQINGYVTSANHELVSNPLIDARVGLVFP